MSSSSFVIRHSQFDHSNTWLPAALLAVLTMLVGALQAFGEDASAPAPLQWRRAATPSRPLPRNTASTDRAKQPERRRFTVPRDSRGYGVVQVAYNEEINDDGWSSSGNASTVGSATLKSVIVHPSDPRYAQLGGGPMLAQAPAGAISNETDEELSRELSEPFGEPDSKNAVDGEIDDEISRELREPFGLPETPGGLEEMPEAPGKMDELPEPELPSDSMEAPKAQPGGREPPTTPGQIPPYSDVRDAFDRDQTPATTDADSKKAEQLDKDSADAKKNCSEEFAALKANRIASIDLSISLDGQQGRDYPFECSIDQGEIYPGRSWPQVTYMWKAAANCHKPLYFEQVQLERYGHSCGPCLQPLVSGAHFFTRLPVLPYCMGIETPNECMYPLGYYRPGNCAPYMVPAVPFTWRAALFQAGATVGTAAVLP